jgi:hypothetical protein
MESLELIYDSSFLLRTIISTVGSQNNLTILTEGENIFTSFVDETYGLTDRQDIFMHVF